MPLIKELHIENGSLLLWEITEELEWLKDQFPQLASDPTFKELKNQKRQKEWLAIKMMLKQIGCDDYKVDYNSNGKPHIKHPYYKHISISHAHTLAGILVHQKASVGLDIESFNRDFFFVENKYLSPTEIVEAYQGENRHCLFWCAKEAVYKSAGIPGLHFSTQIELSLNGKNDIMARVFNEKTTKDYQLSYFRFMEHYIVYLVDHEQ